MNNGDKSVDNRTIRQGGDELFSLTVECNLVSSVMKVASCAVFHYFKNGGFG